MQSRSSNSQARLILIGCLVILLITGVLYFMKRLEAGRLSAELSATKTEKREREDDLNGKVTDYIQKMEEMTKQLGNLQSKITGLEDERDANARAASEAQRAVEECHTQQSQHVQKQGAMEDELSVLRDECQKDKVKVQEHLSSLTQLQQAAKESEMELDACQNSYTLCQNKIAGLQAEVVQAKAHCDQQQSMASRQVVNPGLAGNSFSNPNAAVRQRVPVPNHFQQSDLSINQPQLSSLEDKDKVHVPSYPEEEEEEEEGNPLSNKDADLFNKEEEENFLDENEDLFNKDEEDIGVDEQKEMMENKNPDDQYEEDKFGEADML